VAAPATDPLPQPLADRVALVTGANTGIGREAAIGLARRGARVFLACRSEQRTRPVIDAIEASCPGAQASWLPLDLGDFDSVRRCANAFLDLDLPLHLLVNNAGLAGAKALTPSGFEPAFGINHMGHFLLTHLLTQRLVQSAPARVVTVASRAHTHAPKMDWDKLRRPPTSPLGALEYCVSKLANVLFSAELGRRLAGTGVTTYALHPGVVASDFWRRFPKWMQPVLHACMISSAKGARTVLHCACEAPASESGLYYSDCRPIRPSRAGADPALAEALWQRSLRWIDEANAIR
jgi:NAD(P)-dependent dehydrogenase (short-subunit alcohol dehydrogenase family)